MKEIINILMCGPLPQQDRFGGISTIMASYMENPASWQKRGLSLLYQETAVSSKGVLCNSQNGRVDLLKSFSAHSFFSKFKDMNIDIICMNSSRGYTLFRDLCSLRAASLAAEAKSCLFLHHVNSVRNFLTKSEILNKKIIKLIKEVDCLLFLSQTTKDNFVAKELANQESSFVLQTFHSYGEAQSTDIKHEDRCHIVYMGHLLESKGIVDLLKVAESLDPNQYCVDICGTGDKRIAKRIEELSDNPKSCIKYYGYVSGEKKEDLYRKADVFCLPSYAEGMPVSLLEAMHFGCVPVVTKVGAIPEVLDDSCALLIDPGDVKGLHAALQRARERYNKLAPCAISRANEYTFEKHVDALAKVFKQIAF